ncbi:hypothetical protein PYR66_09960 [Klebsiella aerogenes]|nr:hypothetical protein PYR66_09960 [Klebsiella aerogenes]
MTTINTPVAFGNLENGDTFSFDEVTYEKIIPVNAGVIGQPDLMRNVQACVDTITNDLRVRFESYEIVNLVNTYTSSDLP